MFSSHKCKSGRRQALKAHARVAPTRGDTAGSQACRRFPSLLSCHAAVGAGVGLAVRATGMVAWQRGSLPRVGGALRSKPTSHPSRGCMELTRVVVVAVAVPAKPPQL
jgi:hypothetical protein